jgi:hypothetical protein
LSSIAATDGRTWPIYFRVKRARDGSNRGRRAVHSLRLRGSRTNSHRLAHSVDVRFGSKADIAAHPCHVRLKRTSLSTAAMSALCQKRTFGYHQKPSAEAALAYAIRRRAVTASTKAEAQTAKPPALGDANGFAFVPHTRRLLGRHSSGCRTGNSTHISLCHFPNLAPISAQHRARRSIHYAKLRVRDNLIPRA